MTITPGQQRAAGRELRLRRAGEAEPEPEGAQSRPFGSAGEDTLRRFAKGPTPQEVEEMAVELSLRDSGQARRQANRGPGTDRPHEQAQTTTLRHWVNRRA